MITTLIAILFILLLARVFEKLFKIPVTLSLIAISYIIDHMFPHILNIPTEIFDETLLLLLPIILLPDIMTLRFEDLKKNWLAILYFAFFAVGVSIFIASFITPYLLPEYRFSLGMLVALFSIVMATDAITVTSIFKNFKLPHNLKFYAESESLFNDATALIFFYFVGLPLLSGENLSFLSIDFILIKVLFLSTVIGLVVGFLGYLLMKLLEDPIDEFIIMYSVSLLSFLIAEHFHVAGILSIISGVVTFKYFIDKDFERKEKEVKEDLKELALHEKLVFRIKDKLATTKERLEENIELSLIVGHFANAFLFILMAKLVDFERLLTYWKEILIAFALTTVIRFVVINIGIKLFKKPFRWGIVLSLAGTKGGLSIIMVHALPEHFEYKEMFEAIVVGIVLLSTFVYTGLLLIYLKINEEIFLKEMEEEHSV
ncbi:MAG: transporter [Aquificae bacterium]|nr:transporter [Aquificota bacterium]